MFFPKKLYTISEVYDIETVKPKLAYEASLMKVMEELADGGPIIITFSDFYRFGELVIF